MFDREMEVVCGGMLVWMIDDIIEIIELLVLLRVGVGDVSIVC